MLVVKLSEKINVIGMQRVTNKEGFNYYLSDNSYINKLTPGQKREQIKFSGKKKDCLEYVNSL